MYFYKINEAEPKYQNLHQLLPRAGIVCVAGLVYLPGNKASARFKQCMAAYPAVVQWPDALEPCGGYFVNAGELVGRSSEMENFYS